MKQVELSLEEWQRLAAVIPKERERALKKLQRWVHYEIIHRGFNQGTHRTGVREGWKENGNHCA